MPAVDRSATTLKVKGDASNAERELRKLKEAIGNVTKESQRLNQSTARGPQINTQRAVREMNRLGNTAKNTFGALTAFNTYTSVLSGVLSGAFAYATLNAANNLFKLGASAESTRERFLALSESISLGRRRYAELYDFAKDRGLEFKGLAEATNQLRVVGFEGGDLDSLIREIGIIAGSSEEKVQRITRALGQMRAFGRVALEELNQLTEAGVPIIASLAKQVGVAEGQVRNLISLGKIDFTDVRAAIKDLSVEGSAFFQASEAQAKTTQAEINRLSNAMFLLADNMNDRLNPIFKVVLGNLSSVIEFFTTSQGAVVGFSAAVTVTLIPAIGAFLLVSNNLVRFLGARGLINDGFRAFSGELVHLNRRLVITAKRTQGLNRILRLSIVLLRAAFATAPIAAFTAAMIGATVLVVKHFERARAEAKLLEDAVRGPVDPINREDDEKAFRQRLSFLDTQRKKVRDIEQEYQRATNLITNIDSAGGFREYRDLEDANTRITRTALMHFNINAR